MFNESTQIVQKRNLNPLGLKGIHGPVDVSKLQNYVNIIAVHEVVERYIYDSMASTSHTGQMSVSFKSNFYSESYETCFV